MTNCKNAYSKRKFFLYTRKNKNISLQENKRKSEFLSKQLFCNFLILVKHLAFIQNFMVSNFATPWFPLSFCYALTFWKEDIPPVVWAARIPATYEVSCKKRKNVVLSKDKSIGVLREVLNLCLLVAKKAHREFLRQNVLFFGPRTFSKKIFLGENLVFEFDFNILVCALNVNNLSPHLTEKTRSDVCTHTKLTDENIRTRVFRKLCNSNFVFEPTQKSNAFFKICKRKQR